MSPASTVCRYQRVMQKEKLILWAFAFSLVIVSRATAIATTTAIANAAESDLASACESTLYPDACESALASLAETGSKEKLKEIFHVSVEYAKSKAVLARDMAYKLTQPSNQKSTSRLPSSIDDCLELLDITVDQLNDVLLERNDSSFHDTRTRLSAALTNQVTCSESIETVKAEGGDALNALVQSLAQYISKSLALHEKIKDEDGALAGVGGGRKLLSDGFPAWLRAGDRKLLEASPEDITADAVVAKDGSGTHTTISEAIAFVSLRGGKKVIRVKAGTYNEYINIPTNQQNVMLMGEGKDKSIIVGSRNVQDGWTTYNSATVAAMGSGFIAKGLTIINKAGPSKNQAVALRLGADKSVVYQCSIQGYQDTLYTHSNRQFYSDTKIYGTVDFIFGNSAVVLQNCYIQPRKPGTNQRNSLTAQGRTHPNQNTGISIQKCRIHGSSDLGSSLTYLGRPWKKYSRTVVMQSYLDGSINSDGWERWSGNFALSTLYYGEYDNSGPGSSTSHRVRWPGVHSSLSSKDASKFTVAKFIVGDNWLPNTSVSYIAGL